MSSLRKSQQLLLVNSLDLSPFNKTGHTSFILQTDLMASHFEAFPLPFLLPWQHIRVRIQRHLLARRVFSKWLSRFTDTRCFLWLPLKCPSCLLAFCTLTSFLRADHSQGWPYATHTPVASNWGGLRCLGDCLLKGRIVNVGDLLVQVSSFYPKQAAGLTPNCQCQPPKGGWAPESTNRTSAVNPSDLTARLKQHISCISPKIQEAKCQRPRMRTQFSKLSAETFQIAMLRNSRRLRVAQGCSLLTQNHYLSFRKFLFDAALLDPAFI